MSGSLACSRFSVGSIVDNWRLVSAALRECGEKRSDGDGRP
jgi:hypothetical protein